MTTLDPTKIVPAASTCSAPSSYGRPCRACGYPAASEAALAFVERRQVVVRVDVHGLTETALPALLHGPVRTPLVHAPAPDVIVDLRGPAGCVFVRG
jgi:hypothetical protein